MKSELPQLDPIATAIAKLAERLAAVPAESIPPSQAAGRILAEPLAADRDSPALDVSAMDGYALRIEDIRRAASQKDHRIAVSGTAAAGGPPLSLVAGEAVRIFTGAPVPPEADCVVQREQTTETEDFVTINVLPEAGQNIRRQGENIRAGSQVLPAGILLEPSRMAAVATFAPPSISVRRRVKVAVLNTGDELVEVGKPTQPWQIHDSNGPTLESWLGRRGWLDVVHRSRVDDNLASVSAAIASAAEMADAVLLTGGVSMGDADYVPDAILGLGGEIAFHRLPIRPGKPVLGASLGGKLLLGLPGNPVSVSVTARVLGLPLLERLAAAETTSPPQNVSLVNPDDKTLDLIWHRLVKIDATGGVQLVAGRGSGDVVALAASDGIVILPPQASGPGPWPLLRW